MKVKKQEETDDLMIELQNALDAAQQSEEEANKLREAAEKSKDKALEDLDLMQKKSQFELIFLLFMIIMRLRSRGPWENIFGNLIALL